MLKHQVHPLMKDKTCMWMPFGYEERKCGKPAAWTFGHLLGYRSRFYCETHGVILMRRCNYVSAMSNAARAARRAARRAADLARCPAKVEIGG